MRLNGSFVQMWATPFGHRGSWFGGGEQLGCLGLSSGLDLGGGQCGLREVA
jgi:hypothetical protein